MLLKTTIRLSVKPLTVFDPTYKHNFHNFLHKFTGQRYLSNLLDTINTMEID